MPCCDYLPGSVPGDAITLVPGKFTERFVYPGDPIDRAYYRAFASAPEALAHLQRTHMEAGREVTERMDAFRNWAMGK